MRYYRIDITNATTGAAILPTSLQGNPISSLLPSGQVNRSALNIELDIAESAYHIPTGNSWVRIWGLGLAATGNAFNLNGANIAVYAGMSKGLPLANPAQARLLVRGQIFQAFGNWVGLDQTVDLLMAASVGTIATPMNFVLNWRAGDTLANALSSTISVAMPNAKQTVNISPNLTQNHDEIHYCGSLDQLASVIFDVSRVVIHDPTYPGVMIFFDGTTVNITDLITKPPAAKAIAFQDLIGQPVWLSPETIQIKTVMRGDFDLGDTVTLPETLITNNAGAFTAFQGTDNNKLTFSGDYQVIDIHHYGNFRQPDALSWNTTMNLIPAAKKASS